MTNRASVVERAREWLKYKGHRADGAALVADLLAIINEVGCSGVEIEHSRYTVIQIDNETWATCRDYAAAEAARAGQ